MGYRLEPAQSVYQGLVRKLTLAGMDPENQWFFSDGAFTPNDIISPYTNTWSSEDFVVLDDDGIIAFFSAKWVRPLDILNSFRIILFEKSKILYAYKGLMQYFDYLFSVRGCLALNWLVAEKNKHAHKIYEKFIKRNCGHKVGIRHHGQKSYTGEISDVVLYEITRDEYFAWKNK